MPQWTSLMAYFELVLSIYALMYVIALARAAKWARRRYHF